MEKEIIVLVYTHNTLIDISKQEFTPAILCCMDHALLPL